MATKRKQQPVRAIPPHLPTGASEHMASGRDRFHVGLEGDDPHYVIRDRVTGETTPYKTLTRSEVDDRAAQLNGRAPLSSPKTLGRLRSRKPIKWANSKLLSPTQWVERLYSDPRARIKLQQYQATGRAPLLADFEALMASVAPSIPVDGPMLDKVSQQLKRKFGIKRPRDQTA